MEIRHSDSNLRKEFAQRLWDTIGFKATRAYAWKVQDIPESNSEECETTALVHIAAFAWGPHASVKGYPELSTSLKLAEEILTVSG